MPSLGSTDAIPDFSEVDLITPVVVNSKEECEDCVPRFSHATENESLMHSMGV